MKECPRCGRKFSFWQRAVGESKEHLRHCTSPEKNKDLAYLASVCRGCPANCLEKGGHEDKD